MGLRLRLLLGGLKSAIPALRPSYRGTGGTADARYCYSVWLRHLSLIEAAGLDPAPASVVEFGPGDSVGTGIAALLSGTRRYIALDVIDHANRSGNLRVLDELVALFRERADIPASGPLPGVHPRLSGYPFPSEILSEQRLCEALDPRRVDEIRASLAEPGADADSRVRYICPWLDSTFVEPSSVDLVMSQVALQEMDDREGDDALAGAFRASALWLRPGGAISHQIDFRMPEAEHWNEHWTFSDLFWRAARGRRRRFHNRAPLSRYLDLCRSNGFRVVTLLPVHAPPGSGVPRDRLAPRWRSLGEEDLTTTGAYLLAVKE
jgi:hypothetical protein